MNIVHRSGKRKRAVARVTIAPGRGIVRINHKLLDIHEPKLCRMKLREPLTLAGPVINNLNIGINVFGGGIRSQAEAARLAISRALTSYTKDEKIKQVFDGYDRHLLVADVRRKESSKPNCRGQARAKRQKSYR